MNSLDLQAGRLRLAVLRLSRSLRLQAAGQMTASQFSALTAIADHGEVSIGELAAIEKVAPPQVTRNAVHMAQRGWVTRSVDTKDRRITRVAITPDGLEVLDITRSRHSAFLVERLKLLSAEQRELLDWATLILEWLATDEPDVETVDSAVPHFTPTRQR
jgi:DNA-binding MarR family transcriptional regulator